MGYQVHFGSKLSSKLKKWKIQIHNWIRVAFLHYLIYHKPYMEKLIFKAENWATRYILAQNWAQKLKNEKFKFIFRLGLLFRIIWYVTSHIWKNLIFKAEKWATKYILAQNWPQNFKNEKFKYIYGLGLVFWIIVYVTSHIWKNLFLRPKIGLPSTFWFKIELKTKKMKNSNS